MTAPPRGRPTILTKELIEKSNTYLGRYKDDGEVIPTRAGLARLIGVGKSTINYWSRQNNTDPAFLAILEQIDECQEISLLTEGLKGNFNPTIAKMILHHHGYSDRQEVHNSGEQTVTQKIEYHIVDPKNQQREE